MSLSQFHPLIAEWFHRRFGSPTDVQVRSWPAIASGSHVLISAPTGSGKTLAAFLSCLDVLFKQALNGELEDRTQVVYISPLKALSNDVQKNLQQPLAEIADAALAAGLLLPEIRTMVRTGDTPVWDRQQMLRRPPHILITTPESFYLLLTAEKSRKILRDVRTVIADELHAVAPNKRGAHLALSLERLDALAAVPPVRIGLSATQRPIEELAKFLVGERRSSFVSRISLPVSEDALHASRATLHESCTIIDIGHRREMNLAVEVPKDELGAVATNAIWRDIYERIAELVRAHRSTLVFVNTRRLVERVAHHLGEQLKDLGEEAVAAHHGSLSKQIRLAAEERLKRGETRVVVATASLELGIDIGTVDLVCQIGSPRSIATGLQRVGRSGHWIGAMPKGRFFATTRDELIECAALVRAIRAGLLDRIEVPPAPLDILAQQIVAEVACREWSEKELFALCRRAYPYRDLSRREFDEVLHILADGIVTQRNRGRAYLHHDRIHKRLRARRGARLAAITSGGAIPDTANYAVVAEPDGTVVGSVDEDFAVESLAGDIILLGNTSWRIRGVETGTVRVEDAHGAPPTIPFWRGEAPARTPELSAEVAAVRKEIGGQESQEAVAWLQQQCGLDRRGAEQAMAYVAAGRAVLGEIPTQETIVAERFFDEAGGMQLILHAPFGGRLNRAWGLALRKRFCLTFDFELQAAATDEGIVLSLGEKHSFPLETIFQFLQADTVRAVLTQAVLQAPMFMSRWRWNTMRALALLRFANGRKVPPQIQRMRAEDLLAAVFPAATACQDNHRAGPAGEAGQAGMVREIPDHPLVNETIRDCLTEAMDVDGLTTLLKNIEAGTIRCVARETPMPSPFCHEILNANPYAFLDDAPLEERRARAVEMRRSLPPDLADKLGALDEAAIKEVEQEAWPEVRNADELHDVLLTLVWVPETTAAPWASWLPSLLESGRAAVVQVRGSGHEARGWVAAEKAALVQVVFSDLRFESRLEPFAQAPVERTEALVTIVQGWMESLGPTNVTELSQNLFIPAEDIRTALLRLEADGQVLRGRFRQAAQAKAEEWCHRRLLARIHRLTIGKLRREVEPVTTTEFMAFLFRWQHVVPGGRLHGEAGLLEVIRQLAGYEAAASAWERSILPLRLSKYDPEWLDRLCLGGTVMWGRLTPHPRLSTVADDSADPAQTGRAPRIVPTSVAPLSFFPRTETEWLLRLFGAETGGAAPAVSVVAQDLHRYLQQRGASFFEDLVRGTGHLKAQVEEGLWELAAAGLVTADGFDNLRALLDPHRRRAESRTRLRRPRHGIGRWSLLRQATSLEPSVAKPVEQMARLLLDRYGVVFRDLLGRESLAVAWRDLLVCYRRLELQGEVRGGRFVTGFTGEQFALPAALESLRALRKAGTGASQDIKISAADPLNLAGVILPGPRVPSVATNYLVFRDGQMLRTGTLRETRHTDQQVGMADRKTLLS